MLSGTEFPGYRIARPALSGLCGFWGLAPEKVVERGQRRTNLPSLKHKLLNGRGSLPPKLLALGRNLDVPPIRCDTTCTGAAMPARHANGESMTGRSRASSTLLALAAALIQCYATRTSDGCTPLSEHATMAECRKLASEYQRFDTRDLRVKGVPAVVSYHCVIGNAPRSDR